jgi:hypothetical protein
MPNLASWEELEHYLETQALAHMLAAVLAVAQQVWQAYQIALHDSGREL